LLAAVTTRAEAAGYLDVAARARAMTGLNDTLPARGAVAGVPAAPAPDPPHASPATFRREGELWTIAYGGAQVRLRDGKGLRYLAALLARQGEELSVVVLASAAAAGPDDDDRAGLETLGAKAAPPAPPVASELQERLADLDEEIAECARWNDLERGQRARRERDELAAELAAALGLGGAGRRASASMERARYSVSKAIKSAIRLIAREHVVLGRHLETTVRTGTYCRYLPDPLHPPDWHVQL
jgi:hypothetical protein